MGFLLWIVAVLLVIGGIINLLQGQILFGVLLIVVGLAVGPGGYSIFNRRGARA
ncbi:MAG TPA: GPGG-motif small membrane protein [Sporichthya sp.]|nr:GPGG-motif small membrane protein [Sporichthya sp.]